MRKTVDPPRDLCDETLCFGARKCDVLQQCDRRSQIMARKTKLQTPRRSGVHMVQTTNLFWAPSKSFDSRPRCDHDYSNCNTFSVCGDSSRCVTYIHIYSHLSLSLTPLTHLALKQRARHLGNGHSRQPSVDAQRVRGDDGQFAQANVEVERVFPDVDRFQGSETLRCERERREGWKE